MTSEQGYDKTVATDPLTDAAFDTVALTVNQMCQVYGDSDHATGIDLIADARYHRALVARQAEQLRIAREALQEAEGAAWGLADEEHTWEGCFHVHMCAKVSTERIREARTAMERCRNDA
jgi:hypothetical protein